MSGGHFDYVQYRIDDIVESIEQTIEDATKERPPLVTKVGVSVKEIVEKGHYRYVNKHFDSFGEAIRYYSNNRNYKVLEQDKEKLLVEDIFSGELYEVKYYTYEEYADGKYYPDYTEETINEFRKGVEILKKARIYAQRIDWFLSGDDGEENFHRRLKEELKQLNNNSDE